MGLNFLASNSSFDEKDNTSTGNPNPLKYTILRSRSIRNYLILEIRYEGVNNYEGKKILVFEDVSELDLLIQKKIDPHFSENKNHHSPIARFEPTKRGFDMAIMFCEVY